MAGKKFGQTRVAIIDRERCIRERCGYQCAKVCPGVRMGEETVVVDGEGYPVISEELCTGCGICPKKCPAECIVIINLASEMQNPIYQYGENAFRLYGLPLPQDGVVGLIGKNGIGKSTAVRLLANQLQPNFAIFGRRLSHEEIVARLAPEMQNYYRLLGERKLSVSFKPQNVNRIAEIFSGKARQLLEKSDQRGAMGEAVMEFSLESLLEKNVQSLSGGELQRLAIAAAYCRDADIYCFDEPGAYLDIKQRLSVARALKRLAEKKRVLVIEHDLAVFDYLSDYVHVFYGQENAYGVVSKVKSARSGINEYLDGFLKDENVRFRDHSISFSVASCQESKAKKEKFSYPELRKRFELFEFSSEAGNIMEGEVVGLLGENAIGKTVFIKMIAGVEKPDEGQVGSSLRISYKPQYVKAEGDTEVRELFAQSQADSQTALAACRRLSLNHLMEKSVQSLSGGELQRVAIALALSKEADLYLFDEPSAFLDIEQRLEFASLLQQTISGSNKAAFVIDHDLVLLDAISSRMVIFDGESGRRGHASAPMGKREGMNRFLKKMGITLRRDKDSMRPRINKPDSALDREQKEAGEYYYYES
ncbi:MAG: ribosome biogenesis/translation initiation ATPase RLI [Candidatus Micrarchaeota archaeon]|nr:ribosome biogenesis/translation initiation ATPase RLI [Candidatus Micrarchaeota archaeon]